MTSNLSRREMMQTAGAAALASHVTMAAPAARPWPIVEGPDTPKLCLGSGDGARGFSGPEDAGLRRIRQLAVDYVLGGGPRIPWKEADLRARIDRFKAAGLTLYNLMIGVMKELVRHKYTRAIYPEHPRGLDYDRQQPNFRGGYPGGSGYAGITYNVAYARAMLQAALAS